jgi:hypothetical protein
MDVSHPPIGSNAESIAAIVASMDPSCSQYAAYITAQTSRKEMISEVSKYLSMSMYLSLSFYLSLYQSNNQSIYL